MGIPLGINLEVETPERSENLNAPELVLEEAACHFPPVQAASSDEEGRFRWCLA